MGEFCSSQAGQAVKSEPLGPYMRNQSSPSSLGAATGSSVMHQFCRMNVSSHSVSVANACACRSCGRPGSVGRSRRRSARRDLPEVNLSRVPGRPNQGRTCKQGRQLEVLSTQSRRREGRDARTDLPYFHSAACFLLNTVGSRIRRTKNGSGGKFCQTQPREISLIAERSDKLLN